MEVNRRRRKMVTPWHAPDYPDLCGARYWETHYLQSWNREGAADVLDYGPELSWAYSTWPLSICVEPGTRREHVVPGTGGLSDCLCEEHYRMAWCCDSCDSYWPWKFLGLGVCVTCLGVYASEEEA
jgi:hypothetical protein